jgi:hypothetical protein
LDHAVKWPVWRRQGNAAACASVSMP